MTYYQPFAGISTADNQVTGNTLLSNLIAALATELAAVTGKQDAANSLLASIATAAAAPSETIWTDDSGAYYIRLDSGSTISWTTPAGAASSAPGTGARPAGSANIIVDGSRYQAVNASAGAYSVGDFLNHVVTEDPGTGVVIASFWVNVSTNTHLSSAPSAADITPLAPLPLGAATSGRQDTGNTLLSVLAGILQAATSTPVMGTAATSAVVGPFTPQVGRDVFVQLSSSAAWVGSVQLMRSLDGGITKCPVTLNGNSWGLFTANASEAPVTATSASETFYLSITLTSGSLNYRICQ